MRICIKALNNLKWKERALPQNIGQMAFFVAFSIVRGTDFFKRIIHRFFCLPLKQPLITLQ